MCIILNTPSSYLQRYADIFHLCVFVLVCIKHVKHLGLKLGSKSVHATKLSDTLSGGHLYDQAKKWNQGYIRTVQSIKIWLLFKKTSQLQRVCLLLVMLVMGGLLVKEVSVRLVWWRGLLLCFQVCWQPVGWG